MSLFKCDGCNLHISPEKPRLHCAQCPDYDLCANCFVLGTVTGAHLVQHQTNLIRASGHCSEAAAAACPTSASGHPPQQSPVQIQPQQPPGQQGWQILFDPSTNYKPSRSFIDLMKALFTHLDTGRTGFLVPEAYAAFGDANGCPPAQNIWKNAFHQAYGSNREGQADVALKTAYDTFGIEHRLGQRPQQHQRQQSSGSSLGNMFKSTASSMMGAAAPTGPMPLLTLRGFIDITGIEVCYDPNRGMSGLNQALRAYQLAIWRERGDLPRWAFPDRPVQAVVDRVKSASMQSVHNAAMAADIQRQANLAAVNAIGPNTTTEYRYF
jgi:Zinc finger, ZZ type